MKPRPARQGEPWSPKEIHYLSIMFEMRCTPEDMALTFHRTEQAIRQKVAEIKKDRRAKGILIA